MGCKQCEGIEQHFDNRVAEDDLKRYQKDGPDKTTRLLLEGIREVEIEKNTLLDIGGGIGVIQLELMKEGLSNSTGVDASSSYVKIAEREAERENLSARNRQILGDFVEIANEIPSTDIVTLDRVLCCYDDYTRLVKMSTALAKRLYAITYPRDNLWVKVVFLFDNFFRRFKRTSFKTYVHPVDQIHKLIKAVELELISTTTTPIWRVEIYMRN